MRKQVKIETERFFLRELKLSDANSNYLSWFEDPVINDYILSSSLFKKLEDLKIYISKKINKKDIIFLGIFNKVSKKHIGNIKFEPLDLANQSAEVGILIGEKTMRSKGVFSEIYPSCVKVIREFGIRKIKLGVDSNNIIAINTYKKNGFIKYDNEINGVIKMIHLLK